MSDPLASVSSDSSHLYICDTDSGLGRFKPENVSCSSVTWPIYPAGISKWRKWVVCSLRAAGKWLNLSQVSAVIQFLSSDFHNNQNGNFTLRTLQKTEQ